MDDDECIHGLTPATCTMCKSRVVKQALHSGQLPRDVMVYEAHMDSRCPGCGGHIGAGERIYKRRDEPNFECESCTAHVLRTRIR